MSWGRISGCELYTPLSRLQRIVVANHQPHHHHHQPVPNTSLSLSSTRQQTTNPVMSVIPGTSHHKSPVILTTMSRTSDRSPPVMSKSSVMMSPTSLPKQPSLSSTYMKSLQSKPSSEQSHQQTGESLPLELAATSSLKQGCIYFPTT